MSHADAFQTALAAVPALRKDWTGASTGTVNRVTICGDDELEVPGLTDGIYVVAGDERTEDSPITRDVERLRSVVAAIPKGARERAVAAVHGLASCTDAADDEVPSPATILDEDGVEVVVLPMTHQQEKKPRTVHRVYVAEVVDGLAVLCVAEGTSVAKSSEVATGCTTRARESVAVIRGDATDRGSIASAAALAARLRPAKDQPVQANWLPVVTPCVGLEPEPPRFGVVATKLETGEMGSVPAQVLVQPFEDAAAAQRELARYRALVATCTGEYVLYEATVNTPEYRVTRLPPEVTSTGDGGVRFPSFFGAAKKRTGTSQVTEVFAVGPHLVFAGGEADDLEAAADLVDKAVADVIDPRR
ncbi:hypothetical protein [Phycicoccus sonneratiae]|uniref:Uncharacterized protein n=1 Tax=Phycicoccus sonneratiae TaxID=2807628 RepID=A0ABS2CK52_9MICO|nr:hypothetical protein [Phycicoccus sonneraticus]MBM6400265.1 hypothetical protein [Phycicoccus sonneraticus]